MTSKIYDVIVIGSGATGGMAAKELCEAGLSVAVLEAGRKLDPDRDFTEHTWPFDLPFRGFGQPGVIAREQRSAITVASEYNRHLNVFVTDGASFTSSGCVNPTI